VKHWQERREQICGQKVTVEEPLKTQDVKASKRQFNTTALVLVHDDKESERFSKTLQLAMRPILDVPETFT